MKKHSLLLALAILAMMAISLGACSTQQSQATPPAQEKPSGPPDRVELVYFHRGNPCACMKVVGDYIQQVVTVHFSQQVDSGKLTLKTIASDDSKNIDLVRQYNSPPFCLFLTVVRGEARKTYPIDKIWGLTGDKEKLVEFLKTTIQEALDGKM
jgi:hypothetical protein